MCVLPNKLRCTIDGDRRRANKIYRRRIGEQASLFISLQLLLKGNFFSNLLDNDTGLWLEMRLLNLRIAGEASLPLSLDPKHSAELLKHLDKQNEFLQDSYKLMFNELQKLQVEEEMLMHKLYEAMPPYGLTKKADNIGIANGDDTVDKHVENEQKGAGEIANGDDMVDKHQENEQNRTIKIADGDDAMDKNGENEQNGQWR
ncbi:hypothetical protein K1719_013718 [Acacia pycnantha]|nr:hypothetical protein K1719_013718 [Acacia pycnantha]